MALYANATRETKLHEGKNNFHGFVATRPEEEKHSNGWDKTEKVNTAFLEAERKEHK